MKVFSGHKYLRSAPKHVGLEDLVLELLLAGVPREKDRLHP